MRRAPQGHFSQSGRFDRLKELAVEFAFLLKVGKGWSCSTKFVLSRVCRLCSEISFWQWSLPSCSKRGRLALLLPLPLPCAAAAARFADRIDDVASACHAVLPGRGATPSLLPCTLCRCWA